MSALPAYCFYREFEPSPAQTFCFDRHYLLYAARGTLRLEAAGRSWALYPARAAWLRAEAPIVITIPGAMTCCSVLFDTDALPAPRREVTVFDMPPLARELTLAAREWGPDTDALDARAEAHFRLLGLTALDLADRPSNAWMPTGRTAALKRALAYTEARIADDPTFPEVARFAGLSERTLARRFQDETGMTWRQALRRIRMIRAIEALTTTEAPITDVALSTGYSALSAFNTAFQDFTGTSPSAYRAGLRVPGPMDASGGDI